MWLPPITTVAATAEPLTTEEVCEYLRVDTLDFNDQIGGWIKAARRQVEGLTGSRLVPQTVELQASSFGDLDRLPIGPVNGVTGIAYQDATGTTLDLDEEAYELFGAGLIWGVRPIANTSFPLCRGVAGAVRVTLAVGYGENEGQVAMPDTVRVALLELIRGRWTDMSVDVSDWLVDDRLWL